MSLSAFMDKPAPIKNGYAFLDISNLAMAAVFAQQGKMQYVPSGTHITESEKAYKQEISLSFVRFLILNTIAKNVKTFRNEYPNIVLCFDNSDGGYWRKKIAPYYKQNRKEDRQESTFPFADYFAALTEVKQELKENFPYIILDVKSAEADDCIAASVKYLSMSGTPTLIISADGDFKQLQLYDNVRQWSPTLKKDVKVTKYEAQYEKMVKILKGDRKDNVSPMKMRSNYWLTRVEGERAASVPTKFIHSCVEAGDNVLDLLTEEEKLRFIENRNLIDFDYIDKELVNEIVDVVTTYKVNPRSKIYPYLVKTGNSVLSTRMGDF